MIDSNVDVSIGNSLKGLFTLPLQNEINAIDRDPSGSLVASCSDDTTVKVFPILSF